MENLGHTHIDILKIDIEGSEIVVLNKMLDDQIYPKYLCIEFDLKLKMLIIKTKHQQLSTAY